MNPLKRKEISRRTAEQLGRETSQVDEIVSFFYRYVQKRLSSMDHIAVNVPNLGTFTLKKRRVESKLERSQRFLDSLDETSSIRAFELKQMCKRDMEKYQAALDLMQKELERKLQIRQLQHPDAD